RVELVKDHVHDGGLRAFRGLDHGSLHDVQTVDGFRVAVEQLEQQVSPQCLHSIPPPCRFLCQKIFLAEFCSLWAIFFGIVSKKWSSGELRRCWSGSARPGGRAPTVTFCLRSSA